MKPKYLTRKVQDGEIQDDDILISQEKLSLLQQAPKIFSDAIAKGWMRYPAKLQPIEEEDVSKWINQYDCERAYSKRQEGMTYRDIGKLMGCSVARVVHILNRGEEIVLNRKLSTLHVTPVAIPSKATVRKHIKPSKAKSKE